MESNESPREKASLSFAITQRDGLVRHETVVQDIVKIGKDPKSHLRVDDEAASRMHAVIEVATLDDIQLIDLGNEPGTLVNGERVNKCKLNVGDEIGVGGTKIVLERVERAGAAIASQRPVAVAPPPSNPFAAAPTDPFAAANPFAASANPFSGNPFAQSAAAEATEGSYTYAMVKGGAPVPSEEVESHASTVEVKISWGKNVLHVDHLTPPRDYFVGDADDTGGKGAGIDFALPDGAVGSRVQLVSGSATGVTVLVPTGATGTAQVRGQNTPLAQLGNQIQLATGDSVTMDLGGITFHIASANAGKVVAGHVQWDPQALIYQGLSVAAHAGLLAAMALFMPSLSGTDEDGVNADQQYLIRQYLDAAAEKELEEKTEQISEDEADNKEGGTGTRAKGEEGQMGKDTSKDTNKRFGIQGPQDNPDPHMAKMAALRDAAEFGMIGLLNTGAGGDPNAPTAPWGQDTSLGNDPLSARGNMWGDAIGDAFGAGGLGLSGIGEGGGGRGEGIGLGNIGTIGHGAGTGTGQGFGSGHGRLAGSHRAVAPKVRMGATSVSGRLPPEVIQRIVRQNFGRFRLCYENGLRNNPNLQGRVSVRFVIGRDGSVSQVANGGSDLADPAAVSCIVRAFGGLSFPQPEGGIVTVVYPIILTPGG